MKMMPRVLILAALVIPVAHASSWDEYRVVLKDGSWLTAKGKPQTLEDLAHMRLPNGLLAVEELDLIDWHKTRAWNFQAVYLRNVIAGRAPLGVIPLEGESPYGEAIIVEVPDSVDDSSLEGPDDTVPLPDRVTLMRLRVRELGEQIAALKERRSALEMRAASSSPRRAVELREEASQLEHQIRGLRSEQAQLILQIPTR